MQMRDGSERNSVFLSRVILLPPNKLQEREKERNLQCLNPWYQTSFNREEPLTQNGLNGMLHKFLSFSSVSKQSVHVCHNGPQSRYFFFYTRKYSFPKGEKIHLPGTPWMPFCHMKTFYFNSRVDQNIVTVECLAQEHNTATLPVLNRDHSVQSPTHELLDQHT